LRPRRAEAGRLVVGVQLAVVGVVVLPVAFRVRLLVLLVVDVLGTPGVADGFNFLLLWRCSGVAAAPAAGGAVELLADWWPIGCGLRIREEALQVCLLDWRRQQGRRVGLEALATCCCC
jgi:hypothetical protein